MAARNRAQKKKIKYETYRALEEVQQGLSNGDLIEGILRISPRNHVDSYITASDGLTDVYIGGMLDRNRALNGDRVAIQLHPPSKWKLLKDRIAEFEFTESTANAEVLTLEASSPLANDSNSESDYDDISEVDLTGGPDETALSKMNVVEIMNTRPDFEKFIQRTGKVVCIIERKGFSIASGHIKRSTEKKYQRAIFIPKDQRFPHMHIPLSECPSDFAHRPDDYKNSLFLAQLKEWRTQDIYARGTLIKLLGREGNIDVETEAILIQNDVIHHSSDFDEDLVNDLFFAKKGWKIFPEEHKHRKDLRRDCAFTIDPSTARDLDDALSCERLKNGNYKIGVHIADVTYFVNENTYLDEEASKRATSVYLVQKMVPMLPSILSEKLCSLNPNESKLTFSVVWQMTPEGNIVEQKINGEMEEAWFGRAIIRSCAKLSYEHAQDIIDNPDKVFAAHELPQIYGKYTLVDIRKSLLQLNRLAQIMRKRRFDGGALQLNQIKLKFDLNMEDNTPYGFSVFKQTDSHRLVEEFMLLANMAVAKKIQRAFPKQSLLRRHPPPKSNLMELVVEQCQALGVSINASNSKALHQSLMSSQIHGGDEQLNMLRIQVLTKMISKPMQRALYYCSGMADNLPYFHHYALNVNLYTHFTSPIRRYPDIIVHRLLAAALGYSPAPAIKDQRLQKLAQHCNDKKYNAKLAFEQSSDLYLNVFLRKLGGYEDNGMVTFILDRSFEVLLWSLGITKRVYCDKIPDLDHFEVIKDNGPNSIVLTWINGQTQIITTFCLVKIVLMPSATDPLRIDAVVPYDPSVFD